MNEELKPYDYFRWLLNANADYIQASPDIREFVEKVLWQMDMHLKDLVLKNE